MAQYFTDFSSTADNTRPADTTLRRDASANWKKQTVTTDSVLQYVGDSGSPNAISFDSGASSGVTELYTQFSSIDNVSLRFALFASDSPDDEYAATLGTDGTTGPPVVAIQRRVNGSFSLVAVSSFSWVIGNYYNIRFQVSPGSPNQLKVKAWNAGAEEIATWSIETTDNGRVLSSGWSGALSFASSGVGNIKRFGIGTDGDAAPTAPVAPPSGATVEPTLSTTQATAPSPAITAGASVQPSTAQSTAVSYNPQIATGAQVSPPVANSSVVALFPAISTGASVSATAATTTATADNPTVTAATTTTVNPTTASTQALAEDPAIATGVVVYPPCFTTTAAAYSPQVGSAAAVNPTAATTASTSADPGVSTGASVQPTAAQSNVLAFVPAARTGASTTTTAASTLTQSLNPTVVAGIEEYRNKVYLTGVYNREKQLFAHDGRRVTIVGG